MSEKIIEAALAVPLPDDFELSEKMTNNLALELVSELTSPALVLERYGLTVPQFTKLSKTNQFKTLYREAKSLWESDKNAKERIQAKAAMLVEDTMLDVYKMSTNETVAPAARIDAFKTLAKMGRVSGEYAKGEADVGSQFSISINLGGQDDTKVIVEAPMNQMEETLDAAL